MPETKTVRLTGIPLAKFDAKSGSHVLAFFTEERGQVRAAFRSEGRGKRRSAPVVPLFSTYEILFREPTHPEGLYELMERETQTARQGLNAGTPMESWAAASVLSELLLRTTEAEDPHPYLFRMFDKALDQFEAGTPPSVLLAAFLVKFLEHVGYRPRWEAGGFSSATAPLFFIPSQGGVCTGAEPGDLHKDTSMGRAARVSPEEIQRIQRLRMARFEELTPETLSVETSNKWVRLLGFYVEYHLETRLKSLGFWLDLGSGKNP